MQTTNTIKAQPTYTTHTLHTLTTKIFRVGGGVASATAGATPPGGAAAAYAAGAIRKPITATYPRVGSLRRARMRSAQAVGGQH